MSKTSYPTKIPLSHSKNSMYPHIIRMNYILNCLHDFHNKKNTVKYLNFFDILHLKQLSGSMKDEIF